MAIRDFAERSDNTQITYTQIKAGLWEKIHAIYPNIHNLMLETPIKFKL